MPFNSRIIPGEDAPQRPDGELDLPDNLSALADQLRDDANHLATTFGPNLSRAPDLNPVPNHNPAPAPARGAVKSLATAVAVLLACITTAILLQPSSQTNSVTAEPTPQFINTSPPATSTVTLTDLSSPELEALLDLVQRQPDTISVSF